jgi:glycosyltransferase involved in cell wall biosynthesis
MTQNTTVSCVIPAWNAAETIGRALESILRQSVPILEIMVIDDGSTDQTSRIVADFGKPIRLIHQSNAGPDVARNRGIAESTGQFIAMLDADDAWTPNKIERQLSVMLERPQVGVVGCLVHNIATSNDPSILAQLRKYGDRPVPGWRGSDMLIRRSTIEKVGVLDLSLHHAATTEWLQRCSAAGVERYLLQEPLVVRYLRSGSYSSTKTAQGTTRNLDEYLMLAHRRIAAEKLKKQQQS